MAGVKALYLDEYWIELHDQDLVLKLIRRGTSLNINGNLAILFY